MAAVLERTELEASPLADLHAIADQLGLDGFRRLRKADLIDTILGEQPSDDAPKDDSADGDSASDESARKPLVIGLLTAPGLTHRVGVALRVASGVHVARVAGLAARVAARRVADHDDY